MDIEVSEKSKIIPATNGKSKWKTCYAISKQNIQKMLM